MGTFYAMRRAGQVPAPVIVNKNTARWVLAELQAAALRLPRKTGIDPEPENLRNAAKRGRL